MVMALRSACLLTLLAWALFFVASAVAQPTPADRALATDLFQRGRKALLAGSYAEACPLLEESQRLDPAGGTLLNLALCHEQLGRTASAWSEFHDALAQARRERRDDRVQYATQHLAALEGRLSRLLVELSPAAAALPGLHVERDGRELGASVLGVAMPVDPGEYTLRVSAPGHATHELKAAVRDPGATERVLIEPPPLLPPAPPPALQLEAPPAVASAPALAPPVRKAPPAQRPPSRFRRAAIASFALSAVSAALATGFGVRAIKLRDQAENECVDGRCSERAFELNDRARRFADTSTVMSVVAGVGVASGLFLWWRMDVP